MYVIRKRVPRGKKTFEYWQLVQSNWVNGKAQKRVIQHMGPLNPEWGRFFDTPKEAADAAARGMGWLCAADGCGKPPGDEELAGLSGVPKKLKQYLWCEEHAAEFKNEGRAPMSVPLLPNDIRRLIFQST